MFVTTLDTDVEAASGGRLGHLLVQAGAQLRVCVRPLPDGRVDLHFEDGTVARRVPVAAFTFIE